MKQIITIVILLVSIGVQAQKILSHTTTIGKYADSSVELTENTDGTSYYAVFLSSSDIKNIGTKVVKTNTERICLKFNTKEQMLQCLHYLYDFDKGEGYYIDLENKSNNMVLSVRNGFIVGAIDQIDKPTISKWLIGKLLNTMGVSVKKNKESESKDGDDIYVQPNSLF